MLGLRWEPVGLIGCIQPHQTCWIVLLNILSPSLYQFSTKLARSTRDMAELASIKGGREGRRRQEERRDEAVIVALQFLPLFIL